MSQGEEQEHGPRLAERLRRRIAHGGPITFAEFMEAALYDERDGFYSRLPVGERGDFVTGPHISPVFGILLARQVDDFWKLLGEPDPFDVVEVGAGDGTLARDVMQAIEPPLADAIRYTAVERGAAGRAAMADLPVRVCADLSDVEPAPVGCVLANELLDNLPFHRVRQGSDGLAELFVTVRGSRFALAEGPPSSPEVVRLAPRLRPGQEAVVSPGCLEALDRSVSLLGRGHVLLVDYGPPPGEVVSDVHGYRGHRIEADVLDEPGSRDITAGADLELVAGHARSRGLDVWGPLSQLRALLALGFRDLDRRAQARQVEAVAARRGIEALRIYSNRSRANLLLGRAGLGAFRWLCVGVGTAGTPPLAFRPG